MVKLLVVAGIAGLAVGGWKLHSHAVDGGGALVTDRFWIDHMPSNERETVNTFIALTDSPIGAYQAGSRWRGQFEIFKYERKAGELRIVFPQTGTQETLTATAKKCSEKGFDFCLQLEGGSHGVRRYYSMKGWEAKSVTDRPSEIQGR